MSRQSCIQSLSESLFIVPDPQRKIVLGVYRRIECYLDNDDAGRRTLERLRAYFGEKVIDRSSLIPTTRI